MTTAELTLILGMASVTFAARYPVLAFLSRVPMPPSVMAALKFVPPAVLAALITPALLVAPDGRLALSPANATLIGGIVAGLVAWRTHHLLLTLGAGLLAFWGWRALLTVLT
jgi:branched-subunit amino acid transport protein